MTTGSPLAAMIVDQHLSADISVISLTGRISGFETRSNAVERPVIEPWPRVTQSSFRKVGFVLDIGNLTKAPQINPGVTVRSCVVTKTATVGSVFNQG